MKRNQSKKNDDFDSIAEHSRLKIMLALYDADLSYTQLAKETRLANNTLIKRLIDLQDSGVIKPKLHRSSATSKPVIVYVIVKKWKSKIEMLKGTLDAMEKIESICKNYMASYKQRLAEATDASGKKNVTERAIAVIIDSMIAILIQGMLYQGENPGWENFVSTQTLSIAGNVVWGRTMIPEFETLSNEAFFRARRGALQRIQQETGSL